MPNIKIEKKSLLFLQTLSNISINTAKDTVDLRIETSITKGYQETAENS
jgi:hypothetical protein